VHIFIKKAIYIFLVDQNNGGYMIFEEIEMSFEIIDNEKSGQRGAVIITEVHQPVSG
jgi:hypothetical protein